MSKKITPIKIQLHNIPALPGVYRFYNSDKKLLYIGKAKNLKSRIKSYWQKSQGLTPAKFIMVQQITTIDYTLVNSEVEALLLEATLIKKYQPPFNIDLKDDKNWQYLKINLAEPFPRVNIVRQINNDNAKYFGPYTSGLQLKKLWQFIRRAFPFRTCQRDLSNLPNGRVCLLYQLGMCLGPCEKFVSKKDYDQIIDDLIKFLKGNVFDFKKQLTQNMKQASQRKNYELAAKYRDQLLSLDQLFIKQDVAWPNKSSADFINYYSTDNITTFSWLRIRNGLLLNEENFLIKNKLSLSIEDLYEELLGKLEGLSKNIYTPISISYPKSIIPKTGQKKRILDLAQKNAKNFALKNFASWQKNNLTSLDSLTELKTVFKIDNISRIEAYDISNLGPKFTVGAMTVATNGKIDKSQYRKFKIKTVVGQNDPGMIGEVLNRRLNHHDWPMPNLIMIDGGPTQLQAAYKVLLEKNLDKKIFLISLAKKQELIFIAKQKHPLKLPRHNAGLQLLQRLRDEVHRFGITYHRSLRKKADFD